ncbi:phage virion morphogenesis protein [Alcaligenaceae bacterium SJ-26]|nr:phage virion morphogenesis protein [Alcaligenaceae bacterium SJ-26]
MLDDFRALDDWLAGLLANIEPAARRRVNRLVAADLRRSQSQRIARQQNPDGSRYQPRRTDKRMRSKAGAVRRRAMFARLRTNRYLKSWSSADAADVGFRGRAAMIAAVHQAGDDVTENGQTFRMPKRELLGFTEQELEQLADLYLRHLAGARR